MGPTTEQAPSRPSRDKRALLANRLTTVCKEGLQWITREKYS